VREEDNWI